jgi:GT2 family glycosyltransferase
MAKLNPTISVIIINYNQADVTRDCLKSLENCQYDNLEIFVVDNSSAADKRVNKTEFLHVNFIQSEVNLGFAGGNNLAIAKCTGDYILLLNNDTIVTPNFLAPLLQSFKIHPDAGIVSPKIKFYYSDNLIQYAGTTKINPITCRGATIGYKEKDVNQYDFEKQTDLAHGACMLIKREVINKIGMLHESFFLYYEEFDYCEMAKRAGFEIYYNGLSHILHKESISVGKFSPLKSFYMAKNRILFAKRNFKGLEKIISISYYYLIALPKNVLVDYLKGRKENSIATIKGACSHILSN